MSGDAYRTERGSAGRWSLLLVMILGVLSTSYWSCLRIRRYRARFCKATALRLYLKRCPICSVPNVPMPLSRKLNRRLRSWRTPTLYVECCTVTAQQSQL